MSQTSFFSTRSSRVIALVLLFTAALSIRLYDLTDLPLDFHPTRQLLSAIKARALYYQTQPDGVSTEKLEMGIYLAGLKATVEPVVFERLVAFTYRFTGEQLWVARIYSSLFWLIGGIFLFMFVRELTSYEGALVSTLYYLTFPYAIIASRSFQPDILMVMLILAFWWMLLKWMHTMSWTNAILAGLLGGLAIFIKFSAVFFVIGGALGLVLWRFKFRELLHNRQVWLLAILGMLPASIYLIYGLFIEGTLGAQFSGRFIPALLFSPLNYLQWAVKADAAAGGSFIMLALLGFVLTGKGTLLRSLLTGLWISYVVYGLFFDYHIATHDYYHLPFIAIVAVSLGPLGAWFFSHVAEATVQRWQRSAVYVILLFGLLIDIWDVRNQMKAVDYRPQAEMFAKVGKLLKDEKIVALTQDYGSRLEYWGWKSTLTWPYVADQTYAGIRGADFSFDELFNEYSSEKDFFLVTDFEELQQQTELMSRLDAFPMYADGIGFTIFDLRKP